MKKLVLAALVFLFSTTLSGEKSFDLFKEGEYSRAERVLEAEIFSGDATPLTYYNLGVTSEKTGKSGVALHSYLQAAIMAPGFKEASNNLKALSERVDVKIPKTITGGSGSITLYTVLFFISLYLFTISLIWYIFRPDWRVKTGLIPLFLLLLLFSTLFFSEYRELKSEQFVVVIEAADLKSGPDESLSTVTELREGEIFQVEDISLGWVKGRTFQTNRDGWIPVKNIRYLKR